MSKPIIEVVSEEKRQYMIKGFGDLFLDPEFHKPEPKRSFGIDLSQYEEVEIEESTSA